MRVSDAWRVSCRGEQVLVIYDELKKVLDDRLGEKV